MKNIEKVMTGVSIAMLLGISNAQAIVTTADSEPVLNTSNGHYYEVVDLNGTWGDYVHASNNSTYLGLQGHLATITSAEENQWLVDQFTATKLNFHLFGATDEVSEGDWKWVTGEDWSYSNWAVDEPNNLRNEDYIQFWDSNGTWNDIWYDERYYHSGYVIEYESASSLPSEGSSVSAVPVPGAMWLFATGLLGAVGMRKKVAS